MCTTSEAAPSASAEGEDQTTQAAAIPSRRGDVSKCPICGAAIDPDAFHCSQCHNYFCFHCRARLLKSDTQVQCSNQKCDYYAKLICSVCNPPSVKQEEPSVFEEPLDGYWPLWLPISLVVGGVVWYYASFGAAALTFLAMFVVGGLIIHFTWINIFGGRRSIVEERTSTHYHCLRCQQPVREISAAD